MIQTRRCSPASGVTGNEIIVIGLIKKKKKARPVAFDEGYLKYNKDPREIGEELWLLMVTDGWITCAAELLG